MGSVHGAMGTGNSTPVAPGTQLLSLNAGLKATARVPGSSDSTLLSRLQESELQQLTAGTSRTAELPFPALLSGLQAHPGHHLFIDSPCHGGHQRSTEGPGNTTMKEATQPMVL